MNDRLTDIIIGVVTTMWVVNIGAAILKFNGYHSDPIINGIFMGTVGLAITTKFRGKTPPNKGGDDERVG